jgi:hypothetical protein
MPGHRLGHAEDVGAARVQETVPEPHVGPEFGVVPRHAAQVVPPDVADVVVRVHHVAEIPEAVPVPLVDLLEVVVDRGVEVLLDRALDRRRAILEAPDPERLRGLQIRRRADEHRGLGAGLGQLGGVRLARDSRGRIQRQLAGAADAERRAETLLHILIHGFEAVRPGVVVAHVHRRGVGRPHPHGELGRGAARLVHFERRRIGLPEILQADRQPAADVARENQARGALAGGGRQPAAVRIGALHDGEAVGRRLDELEILPHRPVGEPALAARVHLRLVRHPLAGDLLGIDIRATFRVGDKPAIAPFHRLDRLGPQALPFARETHVPVLDFLAHRHGEDDAQTADEILLLVAVINDRVHQPHRFLPGVEIEPHDKRQPFAGGFLAFVFALDAHHRAHRTGLLQRDFFHLADEPLARRHVRRIALGAFLQDAHQLPLPRDFTTVDDHRLNETAAPFDDAGLQLAGVDLDRRVTLRHLDDGSNGRRGLTRRKFQRPGRLRSGHGGKARPLERAVRPVGQRPGLHRQRLPVGRRQGECLLLFHGAAGEGHAPAHAAGHQGWRAAEPAHGNVVGAGKRTSKRERRDEK